MIEESNKRMSEDKRMSTDEFKDWITNQTKRNEEIGDVVTESIKKESAKVIPEQVNHREFFNDGIKKNKIICCVWLLGKNGARDKLIGSAKRKVGKTDFVVKGKRYWINYEELKEGKKCYYYDCDVNNAIGTLSFHDRSDRQVIPSQADDMLRDGVVRVLMGKGGIPAMYLLVAFIVVGIAMAGMMYFLSQYQAQQKTIDNLNARIVTITEENNLLKQQLSSIPPPIEVAP
jgi:hypothetical protein